MMANNIEVVIKKIISETCDLKCTGKINPNEKLQDLGINSIDYIKIVVSLEKVFGIEFDVDFLDFKHFETLQDIITYIEEKKK